MENSGHKALRGLEMLAKVPLEDKQQQKKQQRRNRTTFNDEALRCLEKAFSNSPYPDINIREGLADIIGVSEARVQVWFQNRRSRSKRVAPARKHATNVATSSTSRQTSSGPHVEKATTRTMQQIHKSTSIAPVRPTPLRPLQNHQAPPIKPSPHATPQLPFIPPFYAPPYCHYGYFPYFAGLPFYPPMTYGRYDQYQQAPLSLVRSPTDARSPNKVFQFPILPFSPITPTSDFAKKRDISSSTPKPNSSLALRLPRKQETGDCSLAELVLPDSRSADDKSSSVTSSTEMFSSGYDDLVIDLSQKDSNLRIQW